MKTSSAAKLTALAVGLIALASFAACTSKKIVWSRSICFPSGIWVAGDRVTFCPDTAYVEERKAAVATLSVRYGSDASVEAFPMVVETEWPEEGVYFTDTLTVSLLPAAERTASRARMGVFETCDTLRLRHSPGPGWSLTVSPLLQEKELKGVFSVTLELI